MTPEFRGITDKLDITSWENPPFPFDNQRIQEEDKAFWKRYRTTPRVHQSSRRKSCGRRARRPDIDSGAARHGASEFLPESCLPN